MSGQKVRRPDQCIVFLMLQNLPYPFRIPFKQLKPTSLILTKHWRIRRNRLASLISVLAGEGYLAVQTCCPRQSWWQAQRFACGRVLIAVVKVCTPSEVSQVSLSQTRAYSVKAKSGLVKTLSSLNITKAVITNTAWLMK